MSEKIFMVGMILVASGFLISFIGIISYGLRILLK